MGIKQVVGLLTLLMLILVLAVVDRGNCNEKRLGKVMTFRSNGVTGARDSQPVHHREFGSPLQIHRRHRRSVLNANEMKQAIDTHNRGRRMVGSSDMEIMIWNDYLASMADDWAKNCQWKHGQAYRDPSTLPYPTLGQNLYAITGVSSLNVTAAIMEWFNEMPYFNYDTLACQEWQQCGHYTQIAWASSRELGCAYTTCDQLALSNFTTRAIFFACNYGPAGNVLGEKPFKKGPGCSQCETGSWWCNSGLCDRSCSAVGPTCECAPACLNFGSVNSASCSCSCAPGWQGVDCSVPCVDFDSRCDPQPGEFGWPPSYCSDILYGSTVRQSCPKMCNMCRAINNNNNDSTSTKPSLLSMLAVWLTLLLVSRFRSH